MSFPLHQQAGKHRPKGYEHLAASAPSSSQSSSCILPGDPALFKYTWFENRDYLLDLDSVFKELRKPGLFVAHMLAYAVNQVLGLLTLASPTFSNVKKPDCHCLPACIFNDQDVEVQILMRYATQWWKARTT